jgi:hypothetical protein
VLKSEVGGKKKEDPEFKVSYFMSLGSSLELGKKKNKH